MIVMGAKGHSNLGILLLGSVSQGVVQHATKPVLIARPGAGDIESMLIGYEGSAPAKRAIDFIQKLALPPSVRFRVTQVIEPFSVPSGTPISYRKRAIEEAHKINERQHRAADRALNTLRETLSKQGRQVETEVLTGPAGSALEESAREHNVDLIVVGSRKPSPSRHYLLGSTAEKLVRHSPTSVLIVR
jgi:nucleotide-binding universal stress UspA family protein